MLLSWSFYGQPTYKVWEQNKVGEAELARAEIIRAQGIAEANRIIGDSLKNNDAYIHYLNAITAVHDDISAEIQDAVESMLMAHGFHDIAKNYVLYRQKYKVRREIGNRLMETFKEIFFTDSDKADFKRDNANINTAI